MTHSMENGFPKGHFGEGPDDSRVQEGFQRGPKLRWGRKMGIRVEEAQMSPRNIQNQNVSGISGCLDLKE